MAAFPRSARQRCSWTVFSVEKGLFFEDCEAFQPSGGIAVSYALDFDYTDHSKPVLAAMAGKSAGSIARNTHVKQSSAAVEVAVKMGQASAFLKAAIISSDHARLPRSRSERYGAEIPSLSATKRRLTPRLTLCFLRSSACALRSGILPEPEQVGHLVSFIVLKQLAH